MVTSAPRWKTAISKALEKSEKSNVMQLATIESTYSSGPIPKARSIIFRSFLFPPSPTTSSSTDPDESKPLLISTTDIRSPKVTQLQANSRLELAWWFEGSQEQFRISGVGCIVPSPNVEEYREHHEQFRRFVQSTKSGTLTSSGGLAALARLDSGSGSGGGDEDSRSGGFDWEQKRIQVFKTMSKYMKASWCRPVPGSPLIGGEDEAKKWPETVEEPKEGDENYEQKKKNWETALRNFALVVVDPVEIDYVELGVMPNKRTRFWRTEEGRWEEMALVP
ncbi:hypothetical protein K435DRAFT_965746 [Dendrothele bispora CBS 962.96]|uniref:Pyridoxamine 5'-phosphate oxidase Alr4036 family FMN-binding domain-containing protein n=1 Tax=Dendrothele bispora (strain CBS 962.96) TaxID=1314807 RepID=A0A4S8M3W3_DENBC|nr:hypothetical protein K435DRAFT_965746 [Dendrothele bispora CBS 962.96]